MVQDGHREALRKGYDSGAKSERTQSRGERAAVKIVTRLYEKVMQIMIVATEAKERSMLFQLGCAVYQCRVCTLLAELRPAQTRWMRGARRTLSRIAGESCISACLPSACDLACRLPFTGDKG